MNLQRMNRRNFLRYGTTAGASFGLLSSLHGFDKRVSIKGNKILEDRREIEVRGEFDVVVCGGGPAGTAAAIEAGRTGAKTLLIENNGCLGGVWTSGSLTWILDYHHQKGLLKEITGELDKRGAHSPVETGERAFSFDPEAMILLLIQATGLQVRLQQ